MWPDSPRPARRRAYTVGALLPVVLLAAACSEVKGRHLIQEGNGFYKDAEYAQAVAKFEEAARLIPNFPTLWLNKGYTCKRMIIPGAKTPENTKAADCAIEAFDKFKQLAPDDSRGDMLYTQTLFDADRFETLAKIYEQRFKEDAKDEEAVHVLMQVYSKWDIQAFEKGGKLDEALNWYRVNVEQRPQDAEAYYAVGTFIYSQLQMKGGGADKVCWDPRKGAVQKDPKCTQPMEGFGEIVKEQRVDLADEGIKYLQKAVELREGYTDAMAYINLLYRQRALGLFYAPDEWFASIQKAEEWRNRTMDILRQKGVNALAAKLQSEGSNGMRITQDAVDKAQADIENQEDAKATPSVKRKAKASAGSKPRRKGRR